MKKSRPAPSLGPVLMEQRKKRNMTRKQFAEQLSKRCNLQITVNTVYNWEHNRTQIVGGLLTDICSVLGCGVLNVVHHSEATSEQHVRIFDALRAATPQTVNALDYLIYQWKGSIDDLFAFVVLHAVQDEAHREENDRTVLKNYNNCMKEGSLDQRGDTNPYVCMQALERMKRRIANARQKDKSDPRVQQEESS